MLVKAAKRVSTAQFGTDGWSPAIASPGFDFLKLRFSGNPTRKRGKHALAAHPRLRFGFPFPGNTAIAQLQNWRVVLVLKRPAVVPFQSSK